MNRKDKLKQIFTYANALSVSRVFMAIPLVMSLDKGWFDEETRYYVCFAILVCIFLSDILDGPLARWTNQVTNLGKIIDPVADKICMMVVLIHLIKEFGTPFFIFFLLISFRDTLLIVTGIYLMQYREEVFEAIPSGKIFIFLSVAMMVSYIFPFSGYIRFLLYTLTMVFFALSSYYYFRNYRLIFKEIGDAGNI